MRRAILLPVFNQRQAQQTSQADENKIPDKNSVTGHWHLNTRSDSLLAHLLSSLRKLDRAFPRLRGSAKLRVRGRAGLSILVTAQSVAMPG